MLIKLSDFMSKLYVALVKGGRGLCIFSLNNGAKNTSWFLLQSLNIGDISNLVILHVYNISAIIKYFCERFLSS